MLFSCSHDRNGGNFTLPKAGQVQVAVYDARGMEVARLFDESLPAGAHTVDRAGRGAVGDVGGAILKLVGVDGCGGGWVYVMEDGGRVSAAVVPSFEGLLAVVGDDAIIAIDIPIGLPNAGPREADLLARRLLGRPRSSSVFPAPVRGALFATTYEDASAAQRAADGRGLTRQTYGILPKIREVDAILSRFPHLQDRVREVHPEVSFATWGGRAMAYRKSTCAGRGEREALIDTMGHTGRQGALQGLRGHRCAYHDLNDAFGALWTARRIAGGIARVLPAQPSTDEVGLRMEIVA